MRKALLLLFLYFLTTFTLNAQEIVTVTILVEPSNANVTIAREYSEESWGTFYAEDGVITLNYPAYNATFIYIVRCDGYSPKQGSFMTTCNAYFVVNLNAGSENDMINTDSLYRAARFLEYSKKQPRKANKLYKKAAVLGDVRAMGALAVNYRDGKGCIRSSRSAEFWFGEAAQHGDGDALYRLESGDYKHPRQDMSWLY